MNRLPELIGQERSLREVSQAIHFWAQSEGASSAGALHVTCSDESERECVEEFQHGFVQYMLPPLKFTRRSAFRLANPGARYEWGAARIAEANFETSASHRGFTLLVAKINAHCAFEETPAAGSPEGEAFRLGFWTRYGKDSPCCGALRMLLEDVPTPLTDDLADAFGSEGKDRLSILRDPVRTEPRYRPLFAAVVSARLQARKLTLDLQDARVDRPTCWAIFPCVSINRAERDTEILCGAYFVDAREGERKVVYTGLGDDPAAYRIDRRHGMMSIKDDQIGTQRPGRDHRELTRRNLARMGASRVFTTRDERLERVRKDVAQNKHRHHHHARALLRIALPILAEVAPVPAAILAFAHGAAGIHHAFRIHRIATDMEGTPEARLILDEIHERIDRLDGDRAEALLELLMSEYSRSPTAS